MNIRHGAALALAFLAAPLGAGAAPQPAQLMTALKTMPAQTDKFRSLMSNLSASQFHVVSVDAEDAAVKNALKKEASDVADLRETLTHTTVTGADGVIVPLRKILLAKTVTIDRVIGVYVGADDQITLFYE